MLEVMRTSNPLTTSVSRRNENALSIQRFSAKFASMSYLESKSLF